MNVVGELLKERERLLSVIEEGKRAGPKLKQINVLIALYGDGENVSLLDEVPVKQELWCGVCDAGPFRGVQGVATHHHKSNHRGKYKAVAA